MMKRAAALVAVVAFAVGSSVYGAYSVTDKGTWPKTWPAELEPLRKQARSLEGPLVPQVHYEIPFTKREEFEAAWPHLLKVKSKGGPIILMRGPDKWLRATVNAGVRVHAPPRLSKNPDSPIPHQEYVRVRWMNTTYIELIVDEDIVDLNRIPLPADTLIIDERFGDKE